MEGRQTFPYFDKGWDEYAIHILTFENGMGVAMGCGMRLKHIDHCFYKISSAQAKALSIEGRHPRQGYEIRADPSKLQDVVLIYRHHDGEYRQSGMQITNADSAWVTRTPLRWFNGKPVKSGVVFALHVNFR